MSGKTVNSAILLLVIGNAMALISDVFIKLMEPGAPILVMVLSVFLFRERLTPHSAQGWLYGEFQSRWDSSSNTWGS